MDSSDESGSSDAEVEQLTDIASKIIEEYPEDEKMDTDSSDSSSSESENEADESNKNQEEVEGGIELFTIDRNPMTESNKKAFLDIKTDTSENNKTGKNSRKRRRKKKNHVNSINENIKKNNKNNELQLASEIGAGMELPGIYINVKPWQNPLKKMEELSKLQKNSLHKDLKVMEKSVITPDFERTESLPKYHEAVRKIKRDRKKLREMTKGKKWFDLPATDLNEENKKSLEILQMRKALDPKRFYKSNDLTDFPRYSQFGTIVEGAADFYSARIPKKQRKQTLVDELLADAEFRTYNKRKFEEIQAAKRRGTGAYEGSKRMINKKKGPMHRQPDKRQKKMFINSKALSKGWRPKK